jgi:hypothetical protein
MHDSISFMEKCASKGLHESGRCITASIRGTTSQHEIGMRGSRQNKVPALADKSAFRIPVAVVPDSRPMENALGNVSGSYLNLVSLIAAPTRSNESVDSTWQSRYPI